MMRELVERLRHALRNLSTLDPVTRLPNRARVHLRAAQVLAGTGTRTAALLWIGLDRFKAVNDAYGGHAGDRVLREAGARIARCARHSGFVGRLGDDEFAIVVPHLDHVDAAVALARRVRAELQVPYDLGDGPVVCSASIGIALSAAGMDAATLIQNAGLALTHAKERGGNRQEVFAAEMQAQAVRRAQVEAALRGALERGEFLLHYQPRFDMATGAPVGFEALLRWNHPVQGMLPPAEFIPILEDSGAIGAVGEWVLRSACEQIGAWERAGFQPLPVAVNLAASQFRHRTLDVAIARVIAETGVNAGLLELELTESSLMHDPDEAVRMLRQLESYGLRISVDDFGTGYSSLAYLKRFPLDALKIDRTFVHDAPLNPDSTAIIRAIVDLAHALGLRVVAEGVETDQQRTLLASLGCDEMQGFLLARPMPAAEAAAFLPPALSALRAANAR